MERRHLRAEDGVILFHFFCKNNFLNGRGLDIPFPVLLFFGADGCQKRTDTDTGCAEIVYLVNFQTGVDLAASVQDFIHLIGCNGIQAAAKGIQLNQVKILPCFYKACGSIKPGMIHPLVIDTDRTLNVCQMGNGILCENSKSVAVNKIRDTVMDFRVNMVRTACQDNAPAPCFFQVFQSFFTLFLNISAGSGQFFPGSVSSSFYFLSRQIFKNFYKAVSKHRF